MADEELNNSKNRKRTFTKVMDKQCLNAVMADLIKVEEMFKKAQKEERIDDEILADGLQILERQRNRIKKQLEELDREYRRRLTLKEVPELKQELDQERQLRLEAEQKAYEEHIECKKLEYTIKLITKGFTVEYASIRAEEKFLQLI